MVNVLMVLAAGPGLPEGNVEDRMAVSLDLTSQGKLDEGRWVETAPWIVTRERPGRDTRRSELVLIDGLWAMRSPRGEDEPLWMIEAEVVRPGELIRVRRPDGEALYYRVVAVEG